MIEAAGPGGGRGAPVTGFVARMRAGGPLLAVELRPPRAGLSRGGAMETWIDLAHAIRRLAAREAFLLLTDNAVGEAEEENLHHLATNLTGQVDPGLVVPFLTCKHPLEYCHMYAARARARGVEALTVVGGDEGVGAPRCVPHAYVLRQALRERLPDLALGGWANPHRDAGQQIEYLRRPDFEADYYLTQVVSHHDLPALGRWLEEARARGLSLPGAFGVFLYRSANPAMLERLASYFPVPSEAITREFENGATAEEICARSIVALRGLGIDNIYLCNLGGRGAAERFRRIAQAVDAAS